tara:strand:+ start:354 stop:839 length:486 start_codon:yes stop_codon:yes gene_type:complete
MEQLRELHFDDLNAAMEEARSLLASGYQRHGNWSLGQICRHLTLVQDPSVAGYPKWMSLFAFLRPVMRRVLLPKILSGDSPRGIRTASMFVPPADLDDAREVEVFATSVARFQAHLGDYAPHPAFGRLSRARVEQIHAAHAAHHLRFLDRLDSSLGDPGSA